MRIKQRSDSRRHRAATTLAASADKHAMYELSVQSPNDEVAFIDRTFRRLRGRRPLVLREDFCGTAAFACEWVKSRPDRLATGIDMTGSVLTYARQRHVTRLGSAAKRVTLLRQNVLKPLRGPFDVACAYNYSWWVFKTQVELVSYFDGVRASLQRDGVFYLDIFGGSTSQNVNIEQRRVRGFTYIWEQAAFNPIDNAFLAHIHFQMKDGSRIDRAFSYDWRLWQLAETREHLRSAGFSNVSVYWENADKHGNDTGVFRARTRVENEPSWNAYILAER